MFSHRPHHNANHDTSKVQLLAELQSGIKTRSRSSKGKRRSGFLPDKSALAGASAALADSELEALEQCVNLSTIVFSTLLLYVLLSVALLLQA